MWYIKGITFVILLILFLFCSYSVLFLCICNIFCFIWVGRGSKVVKVLCNKSEGRWFDPS